MKIIKSPNPLKKYRAIFDNGRHTDFGASGYFDFIQYSKQSKELAEKHKQAYIARHRVNENFNDPYSSGSLSRWILWNLPSLSDSIIDYKKRFGFN